MRRLLCKIAILVISAGLALNGAASHSHAMMSSAGAGTASLHEDHAVEHYADLIIEAGGDDCPQAAADSPTQHSHDDGLCKQCCVTCVSASLIPNTPFPILLLSETRATFPMDRSALVAHPVPTDPAIPKTLN
jgi:hypothetical protein